MPVWLPELVSIAVLVAVCSGLIGRLPKVELGHSDAFLRRRFWNWFPLGLTYAFLYMGRYNLSVSKTEFEDLITKADFGDIFGWGSMTYGLAFLLNGPLTDRLGGRVTILIAAMGSALCNLAMGAVLHFGWTDDLAFKFTILYCLNMYFQSFGAVSIVKVNASWFHVRERGTFGGIFGILISLGLYLAFDWGGLIARNFGALWVFYVPAIVLLFWFVVDFFLVHDAPSATGHIDFETGDATHGSGALRDVVKRMLTSRIILTIAAIEFCSGFLRNAVMQWGRDFGKATGQGESLVYAHWGLFMCLAGITGGMVAGLISDRVFGSRRGPVAAFLYAGLTVCAGIIWFAIGSPAVAWLLVFMSLCFIGVHGMLSATASMDFGGKKNAGLATGIIDGCVYGGTALQAALLGDMLPVGDAAKDPAAWQVWPVAMLPAAAVGLLLASTLWNARPKSSGAVHAVHPVRAEPPMTSQEPAGGRAYQK
ncbi:MAG: MFS transporter [Deltaproteobacteria bacterium]|nr:MFS transporter [Deltaproteobacteria bacterium]